MQIPGATWQQRMARLGPGLVMLLAWVVFWWPVLGGEKDFFLRDLTFYAGPMKAFMHSELAAGRFPFWSPHISAGMPFFADITNQVLYPMNAVFWLVPTLMQGLAWFILLHLLFAQFAFYRLVRVLGAGRSASLWGALLYGMAGYTLSITDNVNYLPIVLWGPLAMAFFWRGLQSGALRHTALCGISLAMPVLAGDTLNPMMLAFWMGWVLLVRWRIPDVPAGASRRFAGLHGLAAIGLGSLLCAVQLLPTLELVGLSVRKEALPLDEAALWSFPPQRLVEIIHPFFYGATHPFPHFIGMAWYPVFAMPWAYSVFIGLIPVILAVAGLRAHPRQALIWWGLAGFSLVLAMAGALGYLSLVRQVFPPLAMHRYLEKLIFWTTLGVIVMATLGASAWLGHPEGLRARLEKLSPSSRWLLTLGGSALATVVLLWLPVELWIWPHAHEWGSDWGNHAYPREPHVAGLYVHWGLILLPVVILPWLRAAWQFRGAIAILVIALADVWIAQAAHIPLAPAGLMHPRPIAAAQELIARDSDRPEGALRLYYDDQESFTEDAAIGMLLARIAAAKGMPVPEDSYGINWPYRMLFYRERLGYNYGLHYGLGYLNGRFAPLQPWLHAQMDGALLTDQAPLLIQMSATDYVITPLAPVNPRWENGDFVEIARHEPLNFRVLKAPQKLPRAFLSPEARFQPPTGPGSQLLSEVFPDAASLQDRVILSGGPVPDPPLPGQAALPGATAEILEDIPGRLTLLVRSPYDQTAWLVVNESFFPGWSATVDERETPVYLANKRFMGVAVPPGEHTVSLAYRSRSFLPGLGLSLLGLLLTLGLLVIPPDRTRRPPAH